MPPPARTTPGVVRIRTTASPLPRPSTAPNAGRKRSRAFRSYGTPNPLPLCQPRTSHCDGQSGGHHRVQVMSGVHERQHPGGEAARTVLARGLGSFRPHMRDETGPFLRRVGAHQGTVHRSHSIWSEALVVPSRQAHSPLISRTASGRERTTVPAPVKPPIPLHPPLGW